MHLMQPLMNLMQPLMKLMHFHFGTTPASSSSCGGEQLRSGIMVAPFRRRRGTSFRRRRSADLEADAERGTDLAVEAETGSGETWRADLERPGERTWRRRLSTGDRDLILNLSIVIF